MAELNPTGAAMLAAARKHMADAPFLFLEVPEWPDAEGKPGRIWYRPVMTVNESFAIAGWKADTGDGRYQQAYVLISRALDEKGNKLFSLADEAVLLEVDFDVLKRICNGLLSKPKVDDAKKDSGTIPIA